MYTSASFMRSKDQTHSYMGHISAVVGNKWNFFPSRNHSKRNRIIVYTTLKKSYPCSQLLGSCYFLSAVDQVSCHVCICCWMYFLPALPPRSVFRNLFLPTAHFPLTMACEDKPKHFTLWKGVRNNVWPQKMWILYVNP
jgi:hypothetical protein